MAKPGPKKGEGGSPNKFDAIDKGQIEKLAIAGWTDVQMSDFFNVTEKTWNNWKSRYPNFFQSLKDWKIEADHKVERSLYERACGYSHPEIKTATHEGIITDSKEFTKHYAPDPTSCIFWLKNRQPNKWGDNPIDESEGNEPDGAFL